MDNYPAMTQSQLENAPWNEEEIPEKDFEITCSQTLSKTVTVTTDDYIPGASGVDYEPDGEGGYDAVGWHDSDDTSDTHWGDVYAENEYHTPLQLIQLFKRYLMDLRDKSGIVVKSPAYVQSLIDECDNWIEDETEFAEN